MLGPLEAQFGSARALEAAERQLQAMLRERGILFGDGLLPTYAYAYLAPRARIDTWARRAEQLVAAAERAAHKLLDDPAFFRAMHLGNDGLDLVRIDPGYDRVCVLCRPDGIPTGDSIQFVEVNSDSPAMMMFVDVVARCLLELDAFAPLRELQPPSAADRLLDTLVACYRSAGFSHTPTIAIVDRAGQKTRYEHARLAEHFETRGYSTIVCDPRALRRVGRELHADDRRIDLVYRRALAAEMIERRAEIAPLLDAYRDRAICMVNPLRSYIGGVKSVLSYLSANDAAELVPRTVLLDNAASRELVRASPTKWVLKKSESHGGEAVILPTRDMTAWHAAFAAAEREVWIAQAYLDVPQLAIPVVEADALRQTAKYFNWNPFVFDDSYAGGLVRISSTPLINITLGGGLVPTFAT